MKLKETSHAELNKFLDKKYNALQSSSTEKNLMHTAKFIQSHAPAMSLC